jgi:hypothetical protein
MRNFFWFVFACSALGVNIMRLVAVASHVGGLFVIPSSLFIVSQMPWEWSGLVTCLVVRERTSISKGI